MRSRTVVVESGDGALSLIPFSERGSASEHQVPERSDVRAFVCRQFKKQHVLWASEIQAIRDFGRKPPAEAALRLPWRWGYAEGRPSSRGAARRGG